MQLTGNVTVNNGGLINLLDVKGPSNEIKTSKMWLVLKFKMFCHIWIVINVYQAGEISLFKRYLSG